MVSRRNKYIRTYSHEDLHKLIPKYADHALAKMSVYRPNSTWRYVPIQYVKNGAAEFSREDCIQECWKQALKEEAAFDLMNLVNRTVQQLAYQALLRHQKQAVGRLERALAMLQSTNLDLYLFELTDELAHNEQAFVEAVIFLNPKHCHHKTKIQRATGLSRREVEAVQSTLQIKLFDLYI
jgi:hypothetical protein